MEDQIRITSWSHLPQDILGIIFGKLLKRPAYLIRCRAVCKGWRISKDRITCKDRRLPSLFNFSAAFYRFNCDECTIFDPYGLKVIRKSIQKDEYVAFRKSNILGSKEGWLIVSAGLENDGYNFSVFLYNPHIEEFITLPSEKYHLPLLATFTGNPFSQTCQVFVFCRDSRCDDYDYIASYCLTADKEWRFSFLEMRKSECRGMQYMNEQLYCLFDNGSLKRYSLADGSWILISRNSLKSDGRLSLIKGEDNVLVVCKIGYDECSTFYFDMSSMSWVEKDLIESSAIFVCGKTAMIRPSVGHGQNLKDCKVFYFDSRRCKCYSFMQKSLIETPEYDWIKKKYYFFDWKPNYDNMAFVVNNQEFSLDFCFQ